VRAASEAVPAAALVPSAMGVPWGCRGGAGGPRAVSAGVRGVALHDEPQEPCSGEVHDDHPPAHGLPAPALQVLVAAGVHEAGHLLGAGEEPVAGAEGEVHGGGVPAGRPLQVPPRPGPLALQ